MKLSQSIKLKDVYTKCKDTFNLKDQKYIRVFNLEGVELQEEDIKYICEDSTLYVSKGEPFDAASTFSEYTIDRILGEGGFGCVQLGIHKITKEKVAIKILKTNMLGNAQDIDKVFQEAEILKNLEHPGIVQVKNCITLPDQQVVFIMEYLEGGELLERLQNNGQFDEEEAKEYFKQITEAMNYCHKSKLIHRDLKLENLLCVSNHCRTIRVCDFGIAGGTTINTDMVDAGSLCYMPPEVLLGKIKKLEPSIDVWAMGVILYTMLVGTLPFSGESTGEIKESIIEGKYNIPKEISRKLTKDCLDVLNNCLQLDPEKRISCNELLDHPWLVDKDYQKLKQQLQKGTDEEVKDEVEQSQKIIQQNQNKRISILNKPNTQITNKEVKSTSQAQSKMPFTNQHSASKKVIGTHHTEKIVPSNTKNTKNLNRK